MTYLLLAALVVTVPPVQPPESTVAAVVNVDSGFLVEHHPNIESGPENADLGPVERWRLLVEEHFPPGEVETAMCVLSGESRGDPNADNPRSTARGLFQFLRSTWNDMVPTEVTGGPYGSGVVYDPEANIRAAAWLQAAEGWSQWSVYNRGVC